MPTAESYGPSLRRPEQLDPRPLRANQVDVRVDRLPDADAACAVDLLRFKLPVVSPRQSPELSTMAPSDVYDLRRAAKRVSPRKPAFAKAGIKRADRRRTVLAVGVGLPKEHHEKGEPSRLLKLTLDSPRGDPAAGVPARSSEPGLRRCSWSASTLSPRSASFRTVFCSYSSRNRSRSRRSATPMSCSSCNHRASLWRPAVGSLRGVTKEASDGLPATASSVSTNPRTAAGLDSDERCRSADRRLAGTRRLLSCRCDHVTAGDLRGVPGSHFRANAPLGRPLAGRCSSRRSSKRQRARQR